MATKSQFLKDVKHEIDMLKQHATAEQLDNLDIETFDPDNVQRCIYGQMTGDCQSLEAKELMDKCCIRVFDVVNSNDLHKKTLTENLSSLNGKYEAQDWKDDDDVYRGLNYLSALEGYIYAVDAKNENVIAYLKGETDTLVL